MKPEPPKRIKRFYDEVKVAPAEGAEGWRILLDGKALRTKKREPLTVDDHALALALAEEWRAQGEFLDPAATPLTHLASAAQDNDDDGAAWKRDILDYLGSDLLCYRATAPAGLVERQAVSWDPYLSWLRSECGAALVTTSGIVAVAQPEISIEAVRRVLKDLGPLETLALRTATAILGSAVLGVALWRGDFSADDIFAASRIDETFQAEQWGADEEAAEREAAIRKDFDSAARLLSLLAAARV